MRDFAALYAALDSSTKTNEKVRAMAEAFRHAAPADAMWMVFFLSGRRLKRLVKSPSLQRWAAEAAGIPEWLFGECYDAVGDLSETIALILPTPSAVEHPQGLREWVTERVAPIADMDEAAQRDAVLSAWQALNSGERFVFNKLLTGSFRVGVSQELVVRALSQAFGTAPNVLAHRLMGDWQPTAEFFGQLTSKNEDDSNRSRPYPFCLAHPVEGDVAELGDISEWVAEWKWDGIRAQVIRRGGGVYVWSRGEELITDRFPEIEHVGRSLPEGTVLDGEILAWQQGRPMGFAALQRRIGRKTVSKKLLTDVPVMLVAFDLLERDGHDLRELPLEDRREQLHQVVTRVRTEYPSQPDFEGSTTGPSISVAESLSADDWETLAALRATASDHVAEGLMLKRKDSPYSVGRKRGAWWKWKVAPMTVDAVVVYAQRGSGRRASLYSDYTFALWDGDKLVPFAKAYSGLSDEEMRQVDAWVRRNTREKFGPVRTVPPELVMELAFEGIQLSGRHKSGIAVRFPRIARWRKDKRPADADRLEDVKRLLD